MSPPGSFLYILLTLFDLRYNKIGWEAKHWMFLTAEKWLTPNGLDWCTLAFDTWQKALYVFWIKELQ